MIETEEAYGKAEMLRMRAEELVQEERYVDADQMFDAATAIETFASQQSRPWRRWAERLLRSLPQRLRRGRAL